MALIRPVSDLHLEFYDQYKKDFRLKVDIDAATILVLAGDIHLGDQSEKYIKRWSKRFQHIILVAGNHEFYNLEINSTITKLKEMTDRYENVSFLNNSIVEVEDVLFVGATLWSDYDNNNPISMWNAQQNMNDFLCIQYNDDRFSPQKAYFFHK